MKFKRPMSGEGRRRVVKSAELANLREQNETEFEFDPVLAVPAEIWERIDIFLQTERNAKPTTQLPLLRLAVFVPELRRRVEGDSGLVELIQMEIQHTSTEFIDPDLIVNVELATYAELFSKVVKGLDDLPAPIPHDYEKSLETFDRFSPSGISFFYLAARFKALLQLFPEKKTEILELIQPIWGKLKERLINSGSKMKEGLDSADEYDCPGRDEITLYVDNVIGMVELSKQLRKRTFASRSALPERSDFR